ncbi:copper resistance protein [Rahnella laticis]|uniref:Copper resistance protein n=1 Tax=Rahnella laticis TaxID=2787622 RepID=A0ABS0E126_9GAMM|nr:copper resistance protein [Rahnella laticis]MBF7978802.1 copper resistance protein [Rahnella laticis]MBF7998892.1 copper resistance protein [Rahnella sp. LAC-M12]
MNKQRRSALLYFCLACLVILTCMTQRIAGLNALSAIVHQDTAAAQASSATSEIAKIPAPCELSSKSLLSVPPLLLEFAFLALSLLLAFLSRGNMAAIRLLVPEAVPVPRLRVHLRLCVFRE